MSGGAMRKMAVYLGLVEEQERYDQYGQYTEYQDGDEYAEEPAAPAPAPREPVPAGASVSTLAERRVAAPAVAPAPQRAELSKITTLNPRTYNEARTIGEHFRDGTPVIMNLTEMDGDDAKRLVDFSAGLVFGLRGSIERVSAKVFLLSPVNVTVAAEDKARMAENGFFNQS